MSYQDSPRVFKTVGNSGPELVNSWPKHAEICRDQHANCANQSGMPACALREPCIHLQRCRLKVLASGSIAYVCNLKKQNPQISSIKGISETVKHKKTRQSWNHVCCSHGNPPRKNGSMITLGPMVIIRAISIIHKVIK